MSAKVESLDVEGALTAGTVNTPATNLDAHGGRHNPGSPDAVSTAAPSTQLPDQAAAEGVATALARADHIHPIPAAIALGLDANSVTAKGVAASFALSDHIHAIASGVVSSQAPDQANAAGTSANFARADHTHQIPTAAATTLSASTTNTQGVAATFSRSDHTHVITANVAASQLDANQVAAVGTSAALARADHIHVVLANVAASTLDATSTNTVGTSAALARADHTHALTVGSAITLDATTANGAGSGAALARANHTHALTTGAASTQTPDQANATGTSASLARADHVHQLVTAAAVTLSASTTNTQGVATSFSRSDHTHLITANVAGSTLSGTSTNTVGTSAALARADHTHLITMGTAAQSIAAANSAGSGTEVAFANHVHQGIHSLKVNTGTQRFNDIILLQSLGTTIVDDGAGNFTFDTQFGPNEFKITGTSGLNITYTGGRFINGYTGATVNVPGGTIAVPALTTGFLYVAVNVLNQSSATITASATAPPVGSVPIGQFVTDATTVTSTTDSRSFVNPVPLIHSMRATYSGTGLSVQVSSGSMYYLGTLFTVAATTLALTPSTSGFIFSDIDGVTKSNTTGFPANSVPIATYTTSGSAVTALAGARAVYNSSLVHATETTPGLMSAVDKFKLNRMDHGYLQYGLTAQQQTTTTPGLFIDLALGVNYDSLPNSRFTKFSATEFRTDYAGYVKITYNIRQYPAANDRQADFRVVKNGTLVTQSYSSQAGKADSAKVNGQELSFITTCAVNDLFKFQVASSDGSLITVLPAGTQMLVEFYRVN